MNSYETYRVCRDCFIRSRFKNPPTLEKYRDKEGNCKTCHSKWIGTNVGFHNQDRKWCEIRSRYFDSKNILCRDHLQGKCHRYQCRYAHNKLELQFWNDEVDLMMKRKRPSSHKIRCVICRIDLRDSSHLKTHMQSNEHEARAENMKILPEVGSSLEYNGPIRTRPKPSFNNSYVLCLNFTKRGRCGYGTGCKRAHSEEELKVWKNAQRVEEDNRVRDLERNRRNQEINRERREHNSCGNASSNRSESDFPQSQGGVCPSSSPQYKPTVRRAEVYSRVAERIEGESDYVKYMYGEIDSIGIADVLSNWPNHIEILCYNQLTQTLEESEKEFKWVFRIKSSKPEVLLGILLYEHRRMFRLGGMYKGVKGGRWNEIKYPYVPDRTCYQLHQEIENDTYIDVNVLFMPRIGHHQVNVVLEWMDGVLVARKIDVRVKGAEFREVTKTFKAETQPNLKGNTKTSPQEILEVNWEQKYLLFNTSSNKHNHKIPNNMEERIKVGFYDNIKDKIVKDRYITRFQTLLYLEEFEYKKVLTKYDLFDFRVNFDKVDKQVAIGNDFREERVETAESNCRFITFRLKHHLFEGYRGFRPPKLAYVIPNGIKTAFECSCIHIGVDFLICSITIEAIESCMKCGGQAMVRFTPDRNEYEDMHQALEDMKPLKEAILFPTLRQVQTPEHWNEDNLLSLLRVHETLSTTQKEAVYSIIKHDHKSFPTIICGPFGCGKTHTLSVAAKLIALNFRDSRILIVANTNSCANLHVELLDRSFDTIKMERKKSCQRPILFRHFAFKRKVLPWDRRVEDFVNTQDGVYKCLSLSELKKCSIIVTTTVACSHLVALEERPNAKNLFSHIFIDEAAQMIEPEACIPLSLAGPDTKVALAGDVRQSRPLILSKQGRQYNLDQSLLERLETLPEYQSESLYQCKISLKDNFRSSVEIVHFLSELFYDNCLRANPPVLKGPTNFPSLSFLHVKGEEERLHGFPSFYNEEEAEVTVRALKKFALLGVRVNSIIVLSTYKAQVKLIKEALRKETSKCRGLGHFGYREYCKRNNCVNDRTVEAQNLEIIQGRQYDLIIVNTVRTVTDIPNDISLEDKLNLGLLDDVTQFNTILTRARGWVLVIGNSDCVTNVGDCSNVWSKYVDACEGNKGLFHSVEEFENFEVMQKNKIEEKKEDTREEKQENKNAKTTNSGTTSNKTSSSVGACERAIPPKNVSSKFYETKFNSLHTIITACQDELALFHANALITEAINEQLTFTRIALENLEKQRYLEQQAIQKGMYPSVRIQNPPITNLTIVPRCEQAPALHLTTLSTDIIQPPKQFMQTKTSSTEYSSRYSFQPK